MSKLCEQSEALVQTIRDAIYDGARPLKDARPGKQNYTKALALIRKVIKERDELRTLVKGTV